MVGGGGCVAPWCCKTAAGSGRSWPVSPRSRCWFCGPTWLFHGCFWASGWAPAVLFWGLWGLVWCVLWPWSSRCGLVRPSGRPLLQRGGRCRVGGAYPGLSLHICILSLSGRSGWDLIDGLSLAEFSYSATRCSSNLWQSHGYDWSVAEALRALASARFVHQRAGLGFCSSIHSRSITLHSMINQFDNESML